MSSLVRQLARRISTSRGKANDTTETHDVTSLNLDVLERYERPDGSIEERKKTVSLVKRKTSKPGRGGRWKTIALITLLVATAAAAWYRPEAVDPMLRVWKALIHSG
jgi:hypothetical protein